MPEEPVDQPSGPGDGDAADTSGDVTRWAFLPIGVTFMVLGISQGLTGSGTAFFVIGIAFLALASAGPALRRGRGRGHGDGDGDASGGPDPAPPQD